MGLGARGWVTSASASLAAKAKAESMEAAEAASRLAGADPRLVPVEGGGDVTYMMAAYLNSVLHENKDEGAALTHAAQLTRAFPAAQMQRPVAAPASALPIPAARGPVFAAGAPAGASAEPALKHAFKRWPGQSAFLAEELRKLSEL